MKVITLISQKGGSGKTTISISLGCEAESRGRATVIIDTDPQGSIHKWSKRREDDIPDVVTAHAVSLDDLLRRYDEAGADFAIIDTAGSLSADIVTIAKHSDLILIPSRPAVVDLDAIEDSINISRMANKPAYVVFNAVHPNSNIVAEATKVVLDGFGAQSLPVYFCNRSAFSHCLNAGRSPQEYDPDGKAAGEIRALFDYINTTLLA